VREEIAFNSSSTTFIERVLKEDERDWRFAMADFVWVRFLAHVDGWRSTPSALSIISEMNTTSQ
jgi:hypothetical protein